MSCCSISSRLSLWISKGATCSRKKWQDQITFKILRFLFYFFWGGGRGGGGGGVATRLSKRHSRIREKDDENDEQENISQCHYVCLFHKRFTLNISG